MPDRVELVEVGPRDGLQNESRIVPVARKVALIDLLATAGFRRIEAGSFVAPRRVPQMADSDRVLAAIRRVPGVEYSALTPNLVGFQRAMAARADAVAVFASASEGFSSANLNCSISESMERFEPIFAASKVANVQVRGYVSCVTDCPFDGPVAPQAVARVAAALRDLGAHEISLGDTIGHGTPQTVAAMLEAVLGVVPVARVAGHFHDTGGGALENIAVALEMGVRVFDTSAGGLGGCPYAPGASGNVATELVAGWMAERGVETGLDAQVLAQAAEMARGLRDG